MKKLTGIVFVVALMLTANLALVAPANAETTTGSNSTTSIATLTETLKSLMAKVAELQKQLIAIKGEVRETLKDGIKEGMTSEDVKKIQELLASDTDIYPEGKVTGYYGPLTKEALKRFQKKHEITVTGEINAETKELLEEYLKERFGGKVPQGLLRAPGIWKKVQDNVCLRERIQAWGLFCKDHKKINDDDDDEEDEDEDDFDVEVEVDGGDVTVTFTFDGDDYEVTVDSTDEDDVLDAVADELDEDLEDVDDDLVDEIQDKLEAALEDEESGDEDDAQEALDDAEDAIDAVQADIDAAADDVDTDDAQDALDDAEEALDDAEDAFDDEDFDEAEELANEAEDLADEAADLLEEAIEDAE